MRDEWVIDGWVTDGIRITPTKYNVCALPEDDVDSQVWSLDIEYRGPGDRWAVVWMSKNLSNRGKWHYESLPSNRTDSFKETHRFPFAEALKRAVAAYPKLVVNGMRVDIEQGRLVEA